MESYPNDRASLTQLWKNSSLSMGERRRRSFASIGDTAKLEKETKEKERRLTEIRAAVAAEREIFERLSKEAAAKGSWLKSGQKHALEKDVCNKQTKKPQSSTNMLKSRNFNSLMPTSPKHLSSEIKQCGASTLRRNNNPTSFQPTLEHGCDPMAIDTEEIISSITKRVETQPYSSILQEINMFKAGSMKHNTSMMQDVSIHNLENTGLTNIPTSRDNISCPKDNDLHGFEDFSKHTTTHTTTSLHNLSASISVTTDSTTMSKTKTMCELDFNAPELHDAKLKFDKAYEPSAMAAYLENSFELRPKIERTPQQRKMSLNLESLSSSKVANEGTYELKQELNTSTRAMPIQSDTSYSQNPAMKPLSNRTTSAMQSRDYDEAASHESFKQAVAAWRNTNGGVKESPRDIGSKKEFDTSGCQTESPRTRQIEPTSDAPLTQRSSYFYHLLFQFPNHAPFVKSMKQLEEEKRLRTLNSIT